MLFVQPAVRKLRITCIFSYCKRQCVVSNGGGIIVQDVVQVAQRHAEEYRYSHYEWYGAGSPLQHLGISETEEDYFVEFANHAGHPTAADVLSMMADAESGG